MKPGFFGFVIAMVHVLSVRSRPLALSGALLAAAPLHQGTTAKSHLFYQLTMGSEQGGGGVGNRLGSRPPSCEHKCYGCSPCEATQVPTTAGHVGIQYSNYEPEGWKCKCGHTFYSP